jgi:predicted nucleic acid-binding protein
MSIGSCLVDTNILLRIARRSDPQHRLVDAALAKLVLEGTTLHYTHQNIAELWNVMTRPVARNGFGLTAAEAEREVRVIEAGMSLLPRTKQSIASGGGSSCSTLSQEFRCMTRDSPPLCSCTASNTCSR